MVGRLVFLTVVLMAMATCGPQATPVGKPEDAAALVVASNQLLDSTDFEGAIAKLDQAIALDPELAEAYLNRGYARAQLGDLDGAFADLNKAIEFAPDDTDSFCRPCAYLDRGNVQAARGQLTEAIADYTKATELFAEPDRKAMAYTARGNVYRVLDDTPAALADLDKAIEVDPSSYGAYFNRGTIRRTGGDAEGAVSDYGRAAEVASNERDKARALGYRSLTFALTGDNAGSLADASAALELDPMCDAALLARALVHEDMGRIDEAIADFEAVVEIGGTPDWVMVARVKLDQLRQNP